MKFALLVMGLAALLGSGCATAKRSDGILVPRVEGIVIDGVGGEWGERGYFVEVMSDTAAEMELAQKGSAKMRLGWDRRGVLVMLDVRDDVLVDVPAALAAPAGASSTTVPTAPPAPEISAGDSVEFYVYAQRDGLAGYSAAVGWEKDQTRIKTTPTTRRVYPSTQRVKVEIETARTRVSDGYVLEALLPWKVLGVQAEAAKTAAFQVIVNDVDGPGKLHQLRWHPRRWDFRERNLRTITLSDDRASRPQTITAAAEVQNLRRARVRVDATFEHVGKTVLVREGSRGRVIARGELKPDHERAPKRASCVTSFALPPCGTKLGDVTVEVVAAAPGKLELPDLDVMRRTAFASADVRFESFVFGTSKLPQVMMEDLGAIEDAIGPFELRTIYYDREGNEVSSAEKPGRYGAVVDFRGEDGRVHRKYYTLFRTPKPLPRRDLIKPELTTMPAAYGVDPRVLAEQKQEVTWFFGDAARRSLTSDNHMAVFLAWLNERKAGEGPVSASSWADVADDRYVSMLKKKHERLAQPYFVQTPLGYKKDEKKKWPAILYLHGAGERGMDLGIVRRSPLPARVDAKQAAGERFPFVVISPQCPPNEDWSVAG
jgi:hypothetical protein